MDEQGYGIRINVGRIGKLETREWVEVGGMGWGLGVGGWGLGGGREERRNGGTKDAGEDR